MHSNGRSLAVANRSEADSPSLQSLDDSLLWSGGWQVTPVPPSIKALPAF